MHHTHARQMAHENSRMLLQANASANASAAALENRSNITTTTPSIANASAVATSTSISTPAPPQQQCITLVNTNYAGTVLQFVSNISSAGQCCNLCSQLNGCNVFVYCPQPEREGCDDGSGKIYAGKLCTLKYQKLQEGVSPSAYGSGPSVTWTSGIVSSSNLGQCVGTAEAAASASASAACNSIAYASAVARAESSCGASASAEALAIAVGGRCPVTCEEAIGRAASLAKSNGCSSQQFATAQQTAAILCGASQFAALVGGICPVPACQSAASEALAAANSPPSCASVQYATSIAVARTSCGDSFAAATASIQPKCPVDCSAAIANARSLASSLGCASAAFATAETTAILLCGAQNYSLAVAAGGGLCGIGAQKPTDDKPPTNIPPITEEPRPIAIVPAPERPVIVFPAPGIEVIVPGKGPGVAPVPEAIIPLPPLVVERPPIPESIVVLPPVGETIVLPPLVARPPAAIPPAGEIILPPVSRPIILPATGVPLPENVTRPLPPGAEQLSVLPIPTVILPAGVKAPPAAEVVRPFPGAVLPAPAPEGKVVQTFQPAPVVAVRPPLVAPPAKEGIVTGAVPSAKFAPSSERVG